MFDETPTFIVFDWGVPIFSIAVDTIVFSTLWESKANEIYLVYFQKKEKKKGGGDTLTFIRVFTQSFALQLRFQKNNTRLVKKGYKTYDILWIAPSNSIST